MKITLLVTGVSDDRELASAIDRYVKRLGHYVPFDIEEIRTPKHFSKLTTEELKKEEGQLILSRISPQDMVVVLDERGKHWDSVGFSAQLQKWMNTGCKRIVFIVGGAFGFSEEVYQRADQRMALSNMTLIHQMVRLFFVEQLYRAFTILRNEKYHH
jgi:23S rRNA (pseudouridine1915-N3)-methyltransferase